MIKGTGKDSGVLAKNQNSEVLFVLWSIMMNTKIDLINKLELNKFI